MKILLVCNQGMSTGILVESMYKFADKDDYIEAIPASKAPKVMSDFDVILVGPQIRYKFDELKKYALQFNKQIALIDMQAYGMMDGKKVMSQVMELSKSH